MVSSANYNLWPASIGGSRTGVAKHWTTYTYPLLTSDIAPFTEFKIDGYAHHSVCHFFYHPNAVDFSAGLDKPRVKSVDEFMGIFELKKRLEALCADANIYPENLIAAIEASFRQEFGFSIHEEPTVTDPETFRAYCKMEGESLFIIRTQGLSTQQTVKPQASVSNTFMDLVTQRLEARTNESNNQYYKHLRTHIRRCLIRVLPLSLKGENAIFKETVETTEFPEDLLAIVLERYRMAYTADLVRTFLLSKLPPYILSAIEVTPDGLDTLSQLLIKLSNYLPTNYEPMDHLMTNLYGNHIAPESSKDKLRKILVEKYQNSVDTQASLVRRLGPNYATLFHNYSLYKNWIACAGHIYENSNNLSADQKAALKPKTFDNFCKSEGPRDNGWKILTEFGELFKLEREPVQKSTEHTGTKDKPDQEGPDKTSSKKADEKAKAAKEAPEMGKSAPGAKEPAGQKQPEKSLPKQAVITEKIFQKEAEKSPLKQTAPSENPFQKESEKSQPMPAVTNQKLGNEVSKKIQSKPAVATEKSVQEDSTKILPKQTISSEKVEQKSVMNPSVADANGKQVLSSLQTVANEKQESPSVETVASRKAALEGLVKNTLAPGADGKPVREESVSSVTAANGKAVKQEPAKDSQPQKVPNGKPVFEVPVKGSLDQSVLKGKESTADSRVWPQKRVKKVIPVSRKFSSKTTPNGKISGTSSLKQSAAESMPDSLLNKVQKVWKDSALTFILTSEESKFLDTTMSTDAIVEDAKKMYVQPKKSDMSCFYGRLNGKYEFCTLIFT